MQFKKLAAIAGSAMMAGLALAGPVLATKVTELGKISGMVSVTDSTVSFPMFVIGASAATADVAGAVDVAVNMAANAKTTSSVTTTIPGESVTGGTKLAASGIYLTPYTNPQAVKGIVTASDIPSLLNGGTYSSAAGGAYQYKQYLYMLGSDAVSGTTAGTDWPAIVYERPTTENSPRLSFKTPTSKILWTYKLTFSTPVSLSGVSTTPTLQAAIQGTTINMLGKDFVISDCTWDISNSRIQDITLLGGKNVITVETGTPKTVTIDTKDYTVALTGVAAQTIGGQTYYSAIGDVNGESFTLKAGETKPLLDGTIIAAIKVFQGKTGAADYATIAVGADKVQLTKAGTVTKGTAPITELTSDITSSTTNGWSLLKIDYTPQNIAWIGTGGQVTDPFASTFNIKFNSIIPDFSDTANRQTITFSPSGYNMLITYKNAADAEKQMYTLYTQDGITWRWAASPTTGSAYRDVVFDENANISAVDQDYFVIQKGGFSHTMQFLSYTPSTYQYTFADESGNTITATGSTGYLGDTADLIVDGNTFKVYLKDNSTSAKIVNIDLNGNSAIGGNTSYYPNAAGAEYSYLVPKLITTGQGGLYFYKGLQTLSNATSTPQYVGMGLVGFNATLGAASGTLRVGTASLGTITYGAVNNITGTSDSGYIDTVVTCSAAGSCNFTIGTSATVILTDPGFVLVEEAQQGGTTHNWIYLPVKWGGSTNPRTYIYDIIYSDDTKYTDISVLGTSAQYKGMTTYGTLVDHMSLNLGGTATVSYPDVFTYANVYVLTPTGTISSGGAGGTVTTDKILPITADVIKLDTDSDIDTVKTNNDLIIVGGPCINKLAAEALGKTYPACGASSGIPENAALIQLFADKFATGKTALLIAGWEADNTDLAARIVQTGFPGATTAQKAASSVTVTGTVASPSYS